MLTTIKRKQTRPKAAQSDDAGIRIFIPTRKIKHLSKVVIWFSFGGVIGFVVLHYLHVGEESKPALEAIVAGITGKIGDIIHGD